jgi:hypothetical protein
VAGTRAAIWRFFGEAHPGLLSVQPADFARAVEEAAAAPPGRGS